MITLMRGCLYCIGIGIFSFTMKIVPVLENNFCINPQNTYQESFISPTLIEEHLSKIPLDAHRADEWIIQRKEILIKIINVYFLEYCRYRMRGMASKSREETLWWYNHIIFLEQSLGVKNISSSHYIFTIPHTRYLFKSAGPMSRFKAIISDTSMHYSRYTPVELAAQKTYQTIGKAALYLRLQEAHSKYNITTIAQPELYIVRIDQDNTNIHDGNAIIIEKNISPMIKVDKTIFNLTESIILSFCSLIKYAKITEITANKLFLNEDQVLYCVNFSQPFITSRDFFHSEPRLWATDLIKGYKSLLEFAQRFSQEQLVLNFIRRDRELKALDFIPSFPDHEITWYRVLCNSMNL